MVMLLVLFFLLAVTAVTVAVRWLNLVPERLGVPLQLRDRRSVEATQSKHHIPL